MKSFDRYAWDRECSKAQIYKTFRSRKEAADELLRTNAAKDTALLFLTDDGLGCVYRFADCVRSFDGLVPAEALFTENGYTNGAARTIFTTTLKLTYHFMRRWNERCGQRLTAQMLRTWSDESSSLYLDDEQNEDKEIFYPIEQGAIIFSAAKHHRLGSLTECKALTNQSTHQRVVKHTNKRTQTRWVGQYFGMNLTRYAKTFIGWDQLRRGGTYDNISWYRGKFANEEARQRVSDFINTHLAK